MSSPPFISLSVEIFCFCLRFESERKDYTDSMKFSQLKIGQTFLHKENKYTKSGPLQATMNGLKEPQMIMRSANVELLDKIQESSDEGRTEDEFAQTLHSYHETALALISGTPTAVESKRKQLIDKYQQLLNKLTN